ncbi:hypothetical protein U0070_020803, partial [Myodes glareolus]
GEPWPAGGIAFFYPESPGGSQHCHQLHICRQCIILLSLDLESILSSLDSGSNMERKQDERLIILLDKKANHLARHITDTQPGDFSIYFYVARAPCSPGTYSLSSNLSQGLEPHQHITGLPVQYMPVVG